MRPPVRRYTVDRIVSAGRWAWASSKGDDRPDLCYDGEAFWSGPRGRQRIVAAETVPQEGWWHAKECVCELCRPRGG